MAADNALRGALFFCLLLAASLSDLRRRIIPNQICALILAPGLIPFSPARLLGALVAAPLLIAALCKEDGMGGGDIKLTAAAGVFLGLPGGLAGLVLGLTAVVTYHAADRITARIKKRKAPTARECTLPLAPFLSLGFFAAYLLDGGM